QVARAFAADTPIVCPSGSCASMVAPRMPVSYRVWELSAFLDHVGATPTARNDGVRVAYHSSCHLLRELGVDEAPRRLLAQTGAEVVPLARPDLCCGFGGTFSVRYPAGLVVLAGEEPAACASDDVVGRSHTVS